MPRKSKPVQVQQPIDKGVRSMPLKVNMSNVSSTFELMDNDDYFATFAKYDVKKSGPTSQRPGTPYFYLEFHIDKERHPELANRRLWNGLGSTVNALWAVKEFLIAMGYPQEELDDEDGLDPEALEEAELVQAIREMLDKVKGGQIILRVGSEEYTPKNAKDGETKMRNKIESYISIYDAVEA